MISLKILFFAVAASLAALMIFAAIQYGLYDRAEVFHAWNTTPLTCIKPWWLPLAEVLLSTQHVGFVL